MRNEGNLTDQTGIEISGRFPPGNVEQKIKIGKNSEGRMGEKEKMEEREEK